MYIIFLGPPGSGKGTQASLLSENLDIPTISTGNLFRSEVENKTKLGKELNVIMNTGSLVSDEITNEILDNRLEEDDTDNGFILDGYPRNDSQLEYLKRKFDNFEDIKNIFVIYINVSDDEVKKRITRRRMCSCGETYHLDYKRPAEPNKCDVCGKKLYVRDDDQEDVVEKRLEKFHHENDFLIDFFTEKEILFKIDGERSIEEIQEDIQNTIDDNLK